MAPQAGFEPATDRLTADSSTTELLRNNKFIEMGLNGLEPSTSRLSGVRSNQLSYRPIMLMERVMGIEPTTTAWKAVVLPLNYTRIIKLWLFFKYLFLKADSLPCHASSSDSLFEDVGCVEATRSIFKDVLLVAVVLPLNYTRIIKLWLFFKYLFLRTDSLPCHASSSDSLFEEDGCVEATRR